MGPHRTNRPIDGNQFRRRVSMQRIKHHFCWVKAVAVDAADDNVQAFRSAPTPGAMAMSPLTATATFRVLPTDALPALQPVDLAGFGAHLTTATSSFRAMVGHSLQQLSATDVEKLSVPMTATAVFKTLSNAQMPPLESFDLELATATLPVRALTDQMFAPLSLQSAGDAEPDTATTPIRILMGDSLPPLMFAGATFMGAWQVEADPLGSAEQGVALRFMPVIGSRGDALAWRATDAGKAWASDALAISLLSFAAIGEI
ncbi:MAG: hypothetical protein ACT6S0_15795 [Roseateles sp.]|uniref:hypothetical protein n=1 Tax=Roseateles sp. TaxID=1971397 RepID=UPI00403648BD